MSDPTAAALDLGWSLLTELGAPGLRRAHAGAALDPEPVVLLVARVATAPALGGDPRLRDQLGRWLVHHGGRLSVTRLTGLLRGATAEAQAAWSQLAVDVRAAGGLALPSPVPAGPPQPLEAAPLSLPLERPALALLRLRSLCGIGARADVIGALLAAPDQWQRSADLGHLGYSGRMVGAVLADLHQAGLAARDPRGNAHAFRLVAPGPLRALVGAEGLRPVRWAAACAVVELRLRLAALDGAPAAVQRVEATGLRAALALQAQRLDLPAPPAARGVPDVYPALCAWADAELRSLGG
ncbi:MAG: hypothetical protein JNM72_25085 [Deltaproteobacteria bacterium]|nr:hypothetical protein [Deltaproteobacteria bacterium]